MTCVPSEDFDQPGHLLSLRESLLYAQWVAKDPSFLHADSEDSDHTGRMPRLIWVFAGAQVICCFCHEMGPDEKSLYREKLWCINSKQI